MLHDYYPELDGDLHNDGGVIRAQSVSSRSQARSSIAPHPVALQP